MTDTGQPKNSVLFARVTDDDYELIGQICEARGEDLSDFIRRAIKKELASMGYLSEQEIKALGMA